MLKTKAKLPLMYLLLLHCGKSKRRLDYYRICSIRLLHVLSIPLKNWSHEFGELFCCNIPESDIICKVLWFWKLESYYRADVKQPRCGSVNDKTFIV